MSGRNPCQRLWFQQADRWREKGQDGEYDLIYNKYGKDKCHNLKRSFKLKLYNQLWLLKIESEQYLTHRQISWLLYEYSSDLSFVHLSILYGYALWDQENRCDQCKRRHIHMMNYRYNIQPACEQYFIHRNTIGWHAAPFKYCEFGYYSMICQNQ